MSLIDHSIRQPSSDISPIWAPVITAEVKTCNSAQCRLSGKICVFYFGAIQRNYLCSGDFYFDSSLLLGLIRLEFFYVLMFVLTLADGL
jgi:hypothetical protein